MIIPNIDMPSMNKENKFINSPLVKITKDMGFVIEMQYPLLGMDNAIEECLVRKEVLDKLLKAKSYLPDNITFKIWDAYRPFKLQEELYHKYKKNIIKEFKLEKLSTEEQNKIIKKYVSLPIWDEDNTPLHATGGSVDLTLCYKDTKKDLDMGESFDSFSKLSKTNVFEKEGMNKVIRRNRRLLYQVMTKAGFTNLPSEYWHFDYGNRNWSYYTDKPAIYNGIYEIK